MKFILTTRWNHIIVWGRWVNSRHIVHSRGYGVEVRNPRHAYPGMERAVEIDFLIVTLIFEVPIECRTMRGPVRLSTFLLILTEHQTSEFANRIWDEHVHSRPHFYTTFQHFCQKVRFSCGRCASASPWRCTPPTRKPHFLTKVLEGSAKVWPRVHMFVPDSNCNSHLFDAPLKSTKNEKH